MLTIELSRYVMTRFAGNNMRYFGKLTTWSITILGILICGILLGVVVGWRVSRGYRVAQDLSTSGKFSQLRVALLSYHQDNGRFPPTKYQAEANGPHHSWRTLLLPHVDNRVAWENYDLTQDWDSTKNREVVASCSFLSIYSTQSNLAVANILAIGPNDHWPIEYPLRSLMIKYRGDSFLLVEDPDSRIMWAEPKY